MRGAERPARALALAPLLMLADPAVAARLAIPAGPLDGALAQLAAQAGVDVATTERDLAQMRAPGVSGTMAPARALRRLLAGRPYRAVPVAGGFRIVRAATASPPARAPLRAAPAAMPGGGEIVVTGSKRVIDLLRFPGSVTLAASRTVLAGNAVTDVDAVAAATPILQSTALGAGRDKLFVRGIADSSFIGPTQNATATYFGDVPTGLSGPDPSLVLSDVADVEVLEGPQGTLYGAGSIGGVIRIAPVAPVLGRVQASAGAGVTLTQGGAPGYDAAGMVNLPLAPTAALRVVGYRARAGGYIRDVARNRDDVNSRTTSGGRAHLLIEPGAGWTVDAMLIDQSIQAPDSQYGLRSLGGLARASAIAQPFDDHFLLASLTVRKRWDSGLAFASVTGLSDHRADERYDATAPRPGSRPAAFDSQFKSRLLSEELRLSRAAGTGSGWLVGLAATLDRNPLTRTLGPLDTPRTLARITNRTAEFALFGEGTLAVTPRLALTVGARLTEARDDATTTARVRHAAPIRGGGQARLDPTAALSWRLGADTALFARYAQGFRTGGISSAAGAGGITAFRPDTARVGEIGIRRVRGGATGLSGSVALSLARWTDIQADLIDQRGLPFTSNIGNGTIRGAEAQLDWAFTRRLSVVGGLFAAASNYDAVMLPGARRRSRLPDSPRLSGSAAAHYRAPLGAGEIDLSARVRYVGRSELDPAALLFIRQGDYSTLDIGASWHRRGRTVSLSLENAANRRGDRFALGNPLTVLGGDQVTPSRPRSIRLGVTQQIP